MADSNININNITEKWISDCNEAIVPGINYYASGSTANRPQGGVAWFHIECINTSQGFCLQIATNMNANEPFFFYRTSTSNGWTAWIGSNIENASFTDTASTVTLRNVRFRKQGKVVCGYVEVLAPANTSIVIGTISNSALFPTGKWYFPMWSATSAEYLGYMDIATDGKVTIHPISGLSGNQNFSCAISYIIG